MVWKLQVTGNQGQILWVRVSAYRIHTHQSTCPSPPRLYETLVKCYLFVCFSSWHLMSLPFFDPCCAINDFGQGQPGKYSRPSSSVFSQVLEWMARGSDMLPRSFRDRRCLHRLSNWERESAVYSQSFSIFIGRQVSTQHFGEEYIADAIGGTC